MGSARLQDVRSIIIDKKRWLKLLKTPIFLTKGNTIYLQELFQYFLNLKKEKLILLAAAAKECIKLK